MSEGCARPTAVVVGAGFGGLAAACHLAHAGLAVTVLERAPDVGGKAARHRAAGFAWDTGPTLLTQPDALDETFALAGTRLSSEVELAPLDDVLCRYRFASGAAFDHRVDVEATAREVARFAPRDAARWAAFNRHARDLFERVGAPYLARPFAGTWRYALGLVRRDPLATLAHPPLGSLGDTARRWFRSPELRAFVMRLATYVGAAPDEASAAYAMIAHVEGRGDAAYPRGGIHAVACAMARVAGALGARVELGRAVARVARRGARWRVETAHGGEPLDADVVVLNADPAYALPALLGREPARDAARSLSALVFLLGLRGHTPGLAVHNVFFPDAYGAEFDDVLGRGRLPRDGAVYVSAPSRVDPGSAPPGHEALYALVNAPPDPAAVTPDEVARVRAGVLARLAELDPHIAARVVHEHVLGPRELAATGAPDGAIYGARPRGVFGPFVRPAQRIADAPGVYLAGGATHPGGGVALATLSGRHAAALALEDLGRAPRATHAARAQERETVAT